MLTGRFCGPRPHIVPAATRDFSNFSLAGGSVDLRRRAGQLVAVWAVEDKEGILGKAGSGPLR